VSSDDLNGLVILLTVMWIASALLALLAASRAAALFNMLVAVIIGGCTLPTLGSVLFGYQAYVRRYGGAALRDLRLTVAALALSLLAVCLSLAALRWGRALFVLGWLANGPMVALSIYLAFWFHIF
jgi:hypothetical protein